MTHHEMTTDLTLTLSRTLQAPPVRVYAAWLDPAMLRKFMIPATGGTVESARNEPRVGGSFQIVMRSGDREIPHHGVYTELVPHRRIAFTWQSPHSVDGSLVTLDLSAEGTGTRIDLHQVRFASEGARDGHGKGWTMIIEELDRVLAATVV